MPSLNRIPQSMVDGLTEQLADIAINVRDHGMVADGTSDNLSIFNSLKLQYPNSILYFPRQGTNQTYYFSTSRPDLGGINITADIGVIFKVDATPNLKEMQLLTPLTFQNTSSQTTITKHKNVNYETVLTNIGSAVQDIVNNEVYNLVDMTTWLNKIYVTSTGDITQDGTATKATNQITWASAFTGSPQLIKPSSLVSGSCYEANVNTPTAGVTVGLFMKTSSGEIIRFETTVGTAAWTKKRISPPSTISENVNIPIPNGGAYGCVTGQEQNFQIYYKNSNLVKFMVADYTLFTYRGEYGDVTDIGFMILNSTVGNSVTWKNAIRTDNYVYRMQKPLNLAIVGDSISYGAWTVLSPEMMLPVILQNLDGIGKVTVTNYAISGTATTDWVNTLSNYNFSGFDYVLIMLGTNDQQGGVPVSTYSANLGTIANKVKADGSTPIFQVYPVFTNTANSGVTGVSTSNYGNHASYTQALKTFCLQNGYDFGNARRNFGANIGWYRDNIHPTEQGQIAVLKSWAEVLTRVLMR